MENGLKTAEKKAIQTNLKKIVQEYLQQAQLQFPEEKFTSAIDALTRILISPKNNAYHA